MSTANIDNGEAIGLLLTYRCNLSCNYCYIARKKNIDMTLARAQSILEPLLNVAAGPLDITFVGGETLLKIDLICALVEWIEERTWKRKYRFLGTTNGTLLTDEIKEWLVKHKDIVTLALSYDGLPTTQSFNRTKLNIDLDFFIKLWPQQPIQMTIDSNSVSKLADGVIFLVKKGALVHPNVAFEKYEWKKKDIIKYYEQLKILAKYYNEHPQLSLITQFQHDLKTYADCIISHYPQREVCGAGNGYSVYDVDGKKYPCHILSPLVIPEHRITELDNNLISETCDFSDDRCSLCPYTTNCPTCLGCNFLYRGDIKKRDYTHCRIMRMEVRAFIKKEIARLKNKVVLDSIDATIIDSIKSLINYERQNPLW